MQGYDLEFIAKAKAFINVPVTLLGGAGSYTFDLAMGLKKMGTPYQFLLVSLIIL